MKNVILTFITLFVGVILALVLDAFVVTGFAAGGTYENASALAKVLIGVVTVIFNVGLIYVGAKMLTGQK